MLVQMRCSVVSELTLRRYVMRSNFVLLHQLTNVEETLTNVLCPRNKCAVADYVQIRRVVDVQRHLFKLLTEPELSKHVRLEHSFNYS